MGHTVFYFFLLLGCLCEIDGFQLRDRNSPYDWCFNETNGSLLVPYFSMKAAKPTSFASYLSISLPFFSSQCIREATKSAEFFRISQNLNMTAKIKLYLIKICTRISSPRSSEEGYFVYK